MDGDGIFGAIYERINCENDEDRERWSRVYADDLLREVVRIHEPFLTRNMATQVKRILGDDD